MQFAAIAEDVEIEQFLPYDAHLLT